MLLARAGVKTRTFTRPKQGFSKPAVSIQSWLIAKTDNATDDRHYDVDEEILAVDGSKWLSSMATWSDVTLEKCTEPTKIYPAGTVNLIYSKTDTYIDRMKKDIDAEDRRAKERQKAEIAEARRRLIAGFAVELAAEVDWPVAGVCERGPAAESGDVLVGDLHHVTGLGEHVVEVVGR